LYLANIGKWLMTTHTHAHTSAWASITAARFLAPSPVEAHLKRMDLFLPKMKKILIDFEEIASFDTPKYGFS